jgi:hypothetical protein
MEIRPPWRGNHFDSDRLAPETLPVIGGLLDRLADYAQQRGVNLKRINTSPLTQRGGSQL